VEATIPPVLPLGIRAVAGSGAMQTLVTFQRAKTPLIEQKDAATQII